MSKYKSIYDQISDYKVVSDYATNDASDGVEAKKTMIKELMEKKVRAKRVVAKKTKPVNTLTPEAAINSLLKICDGGTTDSAVNAISTLKAAGWDVQINPAMAWERKGYQITILEPKKEQTNVQPDGSKTT